MPNKALVIGINYTGQANPLRGCVNDAWNIAHFLVNNYGYEPQNILILTDDPNAPGGGLPKWLPKHRVGSAPAAVSVAPSAAEPEKKEKKDKDKKGKDKDKDKKDKKEKKDKKDKDKDKKDKKKEKKEKKRDIDFDYEADDSELDASEAQLRNIVRIILRLFLILKELNFY